VGSGKDTRGANSRFGSWRYKRTDIWQRIRQNQAFNLFLFFLAIYFFIIGIKIMGSGFKDMGKDFSETLIQSTSNPLVGLAIGVFATALVQSSSCTTSTTVAMVMANPSFFPNAIPIIIGANIGTSVTNIIVSLGHIRDPNSFRRAFAGALVHDFFNVMSAALIFPIELLVREVTGKGFLERLGEGTATILLGHRGAEFELIDKFLDPVLLPLEDAITSVGFHTQAMYIIVGLAILFGALVIVTRSARKAIEGKVQKVVDKVLFKNDATSFGFGLILTSFVQSSSVTTSLVVPLVGGGILKLRQIFPYTLGANIGTTVTALLAAMASMTPTIGGKMGLAISLVHLFFNMTGIAIFYPLKKAPINAASFASIFMAAHRKWTMVFILVVFFGVPGFIILTDRFIF